MIPEVRQLLSEFEQVYLDFLEVVTGVAEEELSAQTGNPSNPTLRHWIDRAHWHFGTHLRQIIQTRKNLQPKYYVRRCLHLPELASALGPLAAELVTVTPEVFTAKPAPEKMSIEENLHHLIKAQRDYITPGLKRALERLRGLAPGPQA